MTPEQLRAIRTKVRMTQAEFGAALRVGRDTIQSWEYASSLTRRQINNVVPRLIAAGLYGEITK